MAVFSLLFAHDYYIALRISSTYLNKLHLLQFSNGGNTSSIDVDHCEAARTEFGRIRTFKSFETTETALGYTATPRNISTRNELDNGWITRTTSHFSSSPRR